MPSQRIPVESLYRKEEIIGSGSFGVVYKGHNVETKQVVAIKILNLDIGDEEVKDVQQEITLLSKLSKSETQNIITYHGAFLSGTKIWIIMDYCSGGSVRTLLKAGRIEERYAAVIMREMLVALQFIHNQGIIHRDIKAANVLVFRDGRVQLCDFGVAAQLTAAQVKRTSMIGTPFWMAPEVINGSGYNQKADIWSLGITLYEIITGAPPFADQDIKRAVKLIPSTKPTRLEGSQYSAPLKEFVALCLDEQPDSRPTAEELLKGRFVKATKSVSYSILKDLIIRYQQWREKNKNARDSFLIPNGPGASLSDEEDDDASSFDWDFSPLDPETDQGVDVQQNAQQQSQQTHVNQQHPFSPSQDFTTQRFSDSNFSTHTESCLSQAPTFKGQDDSYISSANISGVGTATMNHNDHLTSPNSKIDKHPLLDIFEEEPGKNEFKNLGGHNHNLLNESRNTNADTNMNENKAGTSIESFMENRPNDINWSSGIESQYNTRNAGTINTDRNIPNISIPSSISTFSPMTNQIEIPSIDDLSSNTKMFPKNSPFSNAPNSSSSTPNLPTHFKAATASSQSSIMNSGASEISSTNIGYQNSSINTSASSGAVNITTWNNSNSNYNAQKNSGRPSINSSSSQSRLNQINLQTNGGSKNSTDLLLSQPDSVPMTGQYNSYTQAHNLSSVSTVSSVPLTTSASEINLNSTYIHQVPPSITDIASMSRRTPSPKRAIRQASIKATNSPLTMSTTSSSNVRIPSQSTQTQSTTSKLGTEYFVDEADEKGTVKNLTKAYIQPSSNAPYYTNSLATSFSTTSLPTMASFSTTPYQQSVSGTSTPASYDGVNLREATLSSPHLKHITQRKLSTSSSSATTGKSVSATYKIAQLRGTSGNTGASSAPSLQASLYSEKGETHTNITPEERIKAQNPSQKSGPGTLYSQNSSHQNESVDHMQPNKIQLYQQQQQYNQRLQHLQQQQLKASLSTSSVVVPASVSIPQDMFSTVSKTISTPEELSKDRETTKNLPSRSSLYSNGQVIHEEQGTIRYKDNEKDGRLKSNKDQKADLTANSLASRLRNPSLINIEDINSYKLSMAASKLENEQRKFMFPVLRPFNCNVMLDSASKEIVVEEFGHQLDSFIGALDALEHKLSPFSA